MLPSVRLSHPTGSGAECHASGPSSLRSRTGDERTERGEMADEGSMPDVAAHATHLLPAPRGRREAARAQPPRRDAACVSGERGRRWGRARSSGRRRGCRRWQPTGSTPRCRQSASVCSRSAPGPWTVRTEGPAAVLSAEAQLGIEAIVSVARPALMLRDGAFGDPPPPWDDILGPYRRNIRTAAMSVGRIGVRGLPQVPYAGTGFLVGRGRGDDQLPCRDGLLPAGPDGDWSFQPGVEANLDFVEDPDGRPADAASPAACASTA